MPAEREEEPMMDIARGDKAVSRHLRDSLKLIRDKSDDPYFKSMVDDILAGRQSLREAAFSSTFERGLSPMFEAGLQKFEELSEEETQRMAQEGEAAFTRLNEQIEEEERL